VFHETNYAAPPFRGPIVLSVHDLSTLLHPETQEPARALHFGRALLRRARSAARVIVPTGAIAMEVREHLRVEPARIRVIHYGLDPRFTPGASPRGRFVLFAGDAGPRKGLDLLHAALPEGAELIAVGPGNRYVSDEVLLQLYRTAAVVVVPSRYEGFGFPVIEAMGCGTPCIASDDPALVEVAGGAALHFPRGDAGALRAQLGRVLQDVGVRQELSEKGIARARQFGWDECARLHAETYREAAQ
jgi:glycosyltransferase involved in cell wall biosynthesis